MITNELPSLHASRPHLRARAAAARAVRAASNRSAAARRSSISLEQLSFSPSVLKGLVARGLVDDRARRSSRAIRSPRAPQRRRAATRQRPTQQRTRIDATRGGSAGRRVPAARHHGQRQDARLHRAAAPRRARARDRRPSCSCPRSRSRRRRSIGSAPCSATRSPCCIQRAQRRRALRRMARAAATARSASPSARGRRSSRRCATSARSSSTRSTSRATSRARSPRYHAREVAIVRARAEGAVVVLGSATPSLESWTNATVGEVQAAHAAGARRRCAAFRRSTSSTCARQPKRADATARRRRSASRSSSATRSSARSSTASRSGEQSILLLNRRGYASFVQCGQCGDVADVPELQISLTYHRTPERLVCHYCQHAEAPHVTLSSAAAATRCASAGSARSRSSACSPSAFRRRASRAWTSTRRAASGRTPRSSTASARGEVDILLGTQMIAKGLDFPNVTLVGVDRRGRRHQPAGLPRVGAVLPAAEPGGGARGPRAEGRASADPDARADAPRGAVRGGARLQRIRRAGARRAARAGVSADARLANVIFSGLRRERDAEVSRRRRRSACVERSRSTAATSR